MRLRSSREPSSTSATEEQQLLVRLNAYHDAEVSYRVASMDASDISSACNQGAPLSPRIHQVPSAYNLE